MIDKSYMDELKSKFVNAKTESERELVSAEMSAACLNDPKGLTCKVPCLSYPKIL